MAQPELPQANGPPDPLPGHAPRPCVYGYNSRYTGQCNNPIVIIGSGKKSLSVAMAGAKICTIIRDADGILLCSRLADGTWRWTTDGKILSELEACGER